MPDTELAQWLQSRGFYTLLILALLVVGLVLALVRRRRGRGRGKGSSPLPRKPAAPTVRRHRGRPR